MKQSSQSSIERIRELITKLNQWRHEYYNLNAPTVSDTVYDRHYDELERLEHQTGILMSNSPTQTVGYEVVNGLEKTTHSMPLLSLDKTKNITELVRFIGSHQVMIMHKLDGLTVKLEYENGLLVRASTRGNGEEGEVVTHNTRAIEGIPAWIPYLQRLVVVGEVYINRQTFEKLRETLRDSSCNPYKNARNMAAGSIRCHDARACVGRGLVFSPFNVIEGFGDEIYKSSKLMTLKSLGFSTCRYVLIDDNSSDCAVGESITLLKMLADKLGLPIDGIVITYDDITFSLSCGRTGHHYKDGIAFKFEDDLYETVLRKIEWTPSRFGELSPVAVFDSVEIDGCEITRASLHNLTFITDLELMLGCRILISKRNMIIPHVEENLDRGKFNPAKVVPISCPSCNSRTRIKETGKDNGRTIRILRCVYAGCKAQQLRKFVHFVGKKAMNIEGLSESTLDKFINLGYLKNFADIYRLGEYSFEITSLEGFGKKSWQRLQDAIQKSRITTFERYLVAMDIPMIGRTASRQLNQHFNGSLNDFETAVNNGFDFTQLKDFGDVLNHNIHEWFKNKENLELWKELQKMVTIETKNATSVTSTDNPFAGRTVVVTGKLIHFTRASINAKIEALGAKASNAISKSTDYLICGDKAGSKLDKANSLGVTVLSEQQFLQMAEGA